MTNGFPVVSSFQYNAELVWPRTAVQICSWRLLSRNYESLFYKTNRGVNIRSGVFVVSQSLLALRLVLCNLKLNSLEQIARA